MVSFARKVTDYLIVEEVIGIFGKLRVLHAYTKVVN